MPIVRLILQGNGSKVGHKPEALFSTGLERGYFPTRGLPTSVIVHIIGFILVYYFTSFPIALPRREQTRQNIVMIDLNDPLSMMYLPIFDGGTPVRSPARVVEKRVKARQREISNPPSTTTKGFSYPGPQLVISDVPEPTNRFQTVLQPQLEAPAVLEPPILVPNVVQIADAVTAPSRMEEPPAEPEPEKQPAEPEKPVPELAKPEPAAVEPPPKPVESPKPTPPAPKPVEAPKPEPKPAEPAPKPVETPKPVPSAASVPKPDPRIPEPAPKPIEVPLEPEPKPDPKPPEPQPNPVEAPKSSPKAPEPEAKVVEAVKPQPKPDPKPPDTAPKATEAAKVEPKQTPRQEAKPVESAVKQAEPVKPETKAQKAVSKPAAAPSAEVPPNVQPASSEPKPDGQDATPGATRDVLAISPMPDVPGEKVLIPPGEARGRFVISPKANLDGADSEPGLSNGRPAPEIGIGNTTGAPARNGVAPKGAPITPAKKAPALGPGNGKPGSQGNAASADSGRGNGPGSSRKTGNGSGSSAAPAAKKPFAGITIVGGEYEPGTDSDAPPVKPAVRPLQTAYGLSIISTEDSGGGLPFYGVFSHEQIYTVYLEMRTVETDPDPSWTLEFAVNQDDSATAAVRNVGQGIVLPFPTVKEKPEWPAGLARRYQGKMVVVYGIVNTAGKLEQLSIKESPDSQLDEPLLRALSKWVFRPATLAANPVPAKILMGIPVWAPE